MKLWIRLWVTENVTKWLNSADRADVSWASSGRQPKTGKHYGSLTWHPVALACNAGPSDQNIAWLKLPPLLKGVVALPLNSIFKGTMTFSGISTLKVTNKTWLLTHGICIYRKKCFVKICFKAQSKTWCYTFIKESGWENVKGKFWANWCRKAEQGK